MTTEQRASPEVPTWEDEYIDRVSDRLLHNYDLEKDHRVDGERFDLYGQMRIESEKHFFHPSLAYGNHASTEHLFARRVDSVSVADLEALSSLGHDLADEWIEVDEQHFSTDFTFALVAPEIPADVASFVERYDDRNLLKLGYYGHYEVNLLVVAPEAEEGVGSENADVLQAFTLWEHIEPARGPGLLGLIARRLQI